jgi:hypothetical protein
MSDATLDQVTDTAVEAATSEDSFDALAFFSNADLPEDTVTVYQDAKTAYKLADLARKVAEQKELEESEGIGLTDEVEYIDPDDVAELQTKLKASAVIFKLRGLAPAARDAIEAHARATHPYKEGAENTEYNEAFNGELIAKTIVSVSNAKGQTDKNTWDAPRVLAFGKASQPSEFNKLFEGAFRVNYIANAIDIAVGADFS